MNTHADAVNYAGALLALDEEGEEINALEYALRDGGDMPCTPWRRPSQWGPVVVLLADAYAASGGEYVTTADLDYAASIACNAPQDAGYALVNYPNADSIDPCDVLGGRTWTCEACEALTWTDVEEEGGAYCTNCHADEPEPLTTHVERAAELLRDHLTEALHARAPLSLADDPSGGWDQDATTALVDAVERVAELLEGLVDG